MRALDVGGLRLCGEEDDRYRADPRPQPLDVAGPSTSGIITSSITASGAAARTAASASSADAAGTTSHPPIRSRPVALLEGLGYRQMTAVWRLRGLIGFARGRREWGVMTRSGFTSDGESSA